LGKEKFDSLLLAIRCVEGGGKGFEVEVVSAKDTELTTQMEAERERFLCILKLAKKLFSFLKTPFPPSPGVDKPKRAIGYLRIILAKGG